MTNIINPQIPQIIFILILVLFVFANAIYGLKKGTVWGNVWLYRWKVNKKDTPKTFWAYVILNLLVGFFVLILLIGFFSVLILK